MWSVGPILRALVHLPVSAYKKDTKVFGVGYAHRVFSPVRLLPRCFCFCVLVSILVASW
jgi:hypothetical protein